MSKDTILIKEKMFQSLTFKAIYGRKLDLGSWYFWKFKTKIIFSW